MSISNRRDPAPAVSVVVPVRNEAGNISPLVAEIGAALAGRAFEIVYVNDGSKDGTEAELLALTAERPWLRQIRHEQSCGQSAALRTGVTMARAPVVVTIDGAIGRWHAREGVEQVHDLFRTGCSRQCQQLRRASLVDPYFG